MTARECTRCRGHGYVCPKCGSPRSSPMKCHGYFCKSRAKRVPCQGERAGLTSTKTVPHFRSEYTCDGCGIVALDSKPHPWAYYSLSAVLTMHLCEECESRRNDLVATAFDRLLEERGGSMAGIGWKPKTERVKLGPVKPEWLTTEVSAGENESGASVGHPCRCTRDGPFAGLHLSTCPLAQLGTPPAPPSA